tara:strand:+ start:1671 stop:1853 length:183 start_codon:yes stop_codon:yes gene_type:complete
VVAPAGTAVVLYPTKLDRTVLDIPVAKGVVYPSASEYKSHGPEHIPGLVTLIFIVCAAIY